MNGVSPPLHYGVYPGLTPRLMVPEALEGRLDLHAEQALGTYSHPDGVDLLAQLQVAGLQGRGGAGFPAATKWRTVAAASGYKVVVANGEEGEPASHKDQWLLTHRPHLVLDGLLLAMQTLKASRAIMYLSRERTVESVRAAIAELPLATAQMIEVYVVRPSYVAGEETAVCRYINGGVALPTSRPPRPFESGVDNAPTLVSNVETLAHAAWIARHGGAAFREQGCGRSPGTVLVTLNGACRRPGVYEVPLGITVDEMFNTVGGGYTGALNGYAMGGWFGGLLAPSHAQQTLCYCNLREAGSGLGCGSFTALGTQDDPVAFAARVAAWYSAESARQCGTCIDGTRAIAAALGRLHSGHGNVKDRDNLVRWGKTLTGRGACAFLDGAATLARSVTSEFGTAVDIRIHQSDPQASLRSPVQEPRP